MAGKKGLLDFLQEGHVPAQLDEGSIGFFEDGALRAANSIYSALGEVLAAWDSSKDRPQELKAQADMYRAFANAIAAWERKMLVQRGKARPYSERLKMLEEFADICSLYGGDW